MLDQVIYTRCRPHRDLKSKGAVVRSDGFGVFSMSQSIFDPEKKIDLMGLQRQLAKKNGAKEKDAVGLISSYEYFAVSDTRYALTFEFARPFLQDARSGNYSNRSDVYIKQGLVGVLTGYPCDYFGAACWTAHKKGENDYYIDTDPAWLPQVPDEAVGGSVNMDLVRNFVQDGRANAVKNAVWFLLQEYSKPMGERKVLLIKDIPSNVELWVAAIEYAVSAQMAQQITFTTNRTNLNGQTDTALFYYTDVRGQFYPNKAGGNALTRTPYCMIVGFHPQDRFCNIRQQLTSNFVLLDGVTKTLDIQTDSTIGAAYYNTVVQYNQDLQDFCTHLLPHLTLKNITNDLPQLFDAYMYLLDSNHDSGKWNYVKAVEHMELLIKFGFHSKSDSLSKYLLDQCILAYKRFADEDAQKKYALLKLMRTLAATLNREQEVTGCVADHLITSLRNLNTSGDALCRSWRAVENGGIANLLHPFLHNAFVDSALSQYSTQFAFCRPETVRAVVSMYMTTLSQEPGGAGTLLNNQSRFFFVRDALVHMIDSRRDVLELLRDLGRVNNLVNALAVAVAEHLDTQDSRKTDLWWNIVVDSCGGNVLDLCKRLCTYSKTRISLVEKLLCDHIKRTGGCSWETQNIFETATKKFAPDADTGMAFFRTWIQEMKITDTADVVRAAKQIRLSRSVAVAVFHMLDDAVGLEITEKDYTRHSRELYNWSVELGVDSRQLSFGKLLIDLERAKDADDVLDSVLAFGEKQFPVDDDFLDSEYFSDLAQAVRKLEDMELTLALLMAFRFDREADHRKYVDEYVKFVMDTTRGSGKLRQLVVLTEAMLAMEPRRGRKGTLVNTIQGYLADSLKKHAPQDIRPDKVETLKCDKVVKDELLKILKDSGSGSKPGGFFGGWGGSGGNSGGFFGGWGGGRDNGRESNRDGSRDSSADTGSGGGFWRRK